jgi:hypothetical protein
MLISEIFPISITPNEVVINHGPSYRIFIPAATTQRDEEEEEEAQNRKNDNSQQSRGMKR